MADSSFIPLRRENVYFWVCVITQYCKYEKKSAFEFPSPKSHSAPLSVLLQLKPGWRSLQWVRTPPATARSPPLNRLGPELCQPGHCILKKLPSIRRCGNNWKCVCVAETLPGSGPSSLSVSDVAKLPRKQAPSSSVDLGQSGGRRQRGKRQRRKSGWETWPRPSSSSENNKTTREWELKD